MVETQTKPNVFARVFCLIFLLTFWRLENEPPSSPSSMSIEGMQISVIPVLFSHKYLFFQWYYKNVYLI